ncbi:fumarylacetoacetate hydrolase [Lysobacteraceae bacterium NML120232]|nr:fumarylacetoacetate hydrolase [Xanthomonadaceae bacterium NML120232]
MIDLFPAAPVARIPLADGSGQFPVRRVYCVGRNFAEHAREMGAAVPASASGQPVFFMKPGNAVTCNGIVPYPPGTQQLHHEVELVVALGQDAAPGVLTREAASALIFGFAVGLDLTRRDLQAAAKAQGLPWDTGKSFDHCAPVGAMRRKAELPALDTLEISLQVNAETRQHGRLADLIWDVPDILVALSRLYALKTGDLIFMGTPAGVAALHPGDHWQASVHDAAGQIWLHGQGDIRP